MPTIAPVEFDFYPSMQSERTSKYLVAPIDWRDVEQINQHAQIKLIRAAKLSIEPTDSPTIAAMVCDATARVAAELSCLSGDKAFAKVESQAYMLMVAMQKQEQHKAISYGECLDILRDDRNYDEYLIAYKVIKGTITSKPEAEVKQDTVNPTALQNGNQPVVESAQVAASQV